MTETQHGQAPKYSAQALLGVGFELVLPAPAHVPGDPPLHLGDWIHLNANDRVIVRTPGGYAKTGVVDAVANAASVFWISLDGGGDRMAILEEEGCDVWITSGDDNKVI